MAIFTSKLLVYQRVTIIPSEVIHFGRATFAHIAWKSPVTPSCCASFSRLGFTGQILPPKGGVWTFFVQVFFSWLVVLTILKNISQWEGLSHVLWKIKKIQTTNQPGFIHLINQGFSVTGCFQVPITSRICLFSLFQPMDCGKQIRLIHLHFETSWSHGFPICFPIKCPIFGASMGQQPWVFSGPEQLLGLGRAATSTGKPMALASSAPENWRGKITHISYISDWWLRT